jgi:hypothetical protein
MRTVYPTASQDGAPLVKGRLFWLWWKIGEKAGWVTDPVCWTHDQVPMTDEEIEMWDENPPCVHVMRVWDR